jgi:hypothetical protein
VLDATVASLSTSSNADRQVWLTGEGNGTTSVIARAAETWGLWFYDTTSVTVAGPPVEGTRHAMRFENDFLNLDGDTVISCGRACAFPDGTDLKIAFDPTRETHSVVVQNQGAGVEIAYLNGAVFGDITAEDARTAAFTASLIDAPFDGNCVILVRTDQGAVFKIGNAVEAEWAVDGVTFDAAPLR